MRAVRAILVVCGVVLGLAPPAHADGPGVGTPAVVTLGDSAISGEAGRWAGNTTNSPANVDALGTTVAAPFAAPDGRQAVLADPAGVTFSISQVQVPAG